MWFNRYNRFLYGQHFGNVDIEQYDDGEDGFTEFYFRWGRLKLVYKYLNCVNLVLLANLEPKN